MRKVLTVMLACVVSAILLFATGCATTTGMLDQMKKHIPEAAQFVDDYEGDLSVILGIQSRLTDVEYDFFQNGKVGINYLSDTAPYKNEDTTIDSCDFLSEKEKQVIQNLLSGLGEGGYCISVGPSETMVIYRGVGRGAISTDLRITDAMDKANSSNIYASYCEQINDVWYARIVSWKGAA